MASGIRSIVWRSDIDAGRKRPAFFLWTRGEAQRAKPSWWGSWWNQLIGQLMIQLFWKWIARREGKGKEREMREGGEGRRLFVKQIRINKKTSAFALVKQTVRCLPTYTIYLHKSTKYPRKNLRLVTHRYHGKFYLFFPHFFPGLS